MQSTLISTLFHKMVQSLSYKFSNTLMGNKCLMYIYLVKKQGTNSSKRGNLLIETILLIIILQHNSH